MRLRHIPAMRMAVAVQHEITVRPEAARLFRGQHEQKRIHLRRVPCFHHALEPRHGPVHPWQIGIEREERLAAEMAQRVFDAAAGIEQFSFARNDDVDIPPRGAMRLDLIREVIGVDDDLPDADLKQLVERVIEHRYAADLEQRLWRRKGKRPHAFAAPGGQNHRSGGEQIHPLQSTTAARSPSIRVRAGGIHRSTACPETP